MKLQTAFLLFVPLLAGQQSQPDTTRTVTADAVAAESKMAAAMLRHAEKGRGDIARGNRDEALKHVEQALDRVSQIETRMQSSGRKTLVPIYSEFEAVSIIGPIDAARGRTPAKSSSAHPQHDPSLGRPMAAVKEVEGNYTAVLVDLQHARTHLEAARTALKNDQLPVADSALAAVQSGVILVSIEGDLPLVKARQNLHLALAEIQDGDYQSAKAPLQAAADALAEYREIGTSPVPAGDVKKVEQDVRSYVAKVGSSPANAREQVFHWWSKVNSWVRLETK